MSSFNFLAPSQIYALSPEEQQQYMMALQDEAFRESQRQRDRRNKDEKGPSAAQQLAALIGGPAGALGGMYAAQNFLGPGTAATLPGAPVGVSATALPGAGAAGTGAATGAGAGGGGAATAANAANAGGQTTGGIGAGTVGGVPVIPAAGALAGTYLLYRGARDLAEGKTPEFGANEGTAARAQLAFSTGGLSEVARPFGINMRTGKDRDQQGRDAGRGVLQRAGVLDDKFNIRFKDGTSFDMGKDGSEQIYNVDFNKDGASQAVGDVNPLAAALFGGDDKLQSDFAGMFVNATKGDRNKVKEAVEQSGFTKESLAQRIAELASQGAFDKDTAKNNAERDAYLSGIDVLYRPEKPKKATGKGFMAMPGRL